MQDLTMKQRKFIKHFFETGNGTQSARLSGYSGNDNALGARANYLLSNNKISRAIERLKEKAGLSDDKLLDKHKQLLEAKRLHACDVHIKKGESGKYEINENSNDFIEVEDNQVQLGALKLGYQINGRIKEGTGQTNIDHLHFTNIQVKDLDTKSPEDLIECFRKSVSKEN